MVFFTKEKKLWMEDYKQVISTAVRMAERSKALRSGRSPVLRAWVRIPLLTIFLGLILTHSGHHHQRTMKYYTFPFLNLKINNDRNDLLIKNEETLIKLEFIIRNIWSTTSLVLSVLKIQQN